jgi:SAM-dependent methyltransferase
MPRVRSTPSIRKIYTLILLALALPFLVNASAKGTESQKVLKSQSCQFESEDRESPLVFKASEVILKTKPKNLTVLDLGTGNGRNISYLLEKGAAVYAYDADPESIKLIRKKLNPFLKNKKLYVYKKSFEEISSLPTANMIIAWRALPFMEREQFPGFWEKIEKALVPGGIFTGTFFGEQHKTRRPVDRPKLFRSTRQEILNLFKNFQIIVFEETLEYDEEVSKAWGGDQYEHTYKVIARKWPLTPS